MSPFRFFSYHKKEYKIGKGIVNPILLFFQNEICLQLDMLSI